MTWQELNTHELVVYSTVWCGDCRRLKAHLATHNIDYTEIDIDADADAAQRLREATGRTAIPFVQLDGGAMIRGWHKEKPGLWSDKLFLAEAEAALVE